MKKILLLLLLLIPFISKAQDTTKVPKYIFVYLAKKTDLDSLWMRAEATFFPLKDTCQYIKKSEIRNLIHFYQKGMDNIQLHPFIIQQPFIY